MTERERERGRESEREREASGIMAARRIVQHIEISELQKHPKVLMGVLRGRSVHRQCKTELLM